MKISCVVPYFTGRGYLIECLECLNSLSPEYINEVIIVDDGARGTARRILMQTIAQLTVSAGQKGQHIALAPHAANLGPSAARNTGLALVSNEWCLMLDSDDRVISLAPQLAAIEQGVAPEVAWVMGEWRAFNAAETPFSVMMPEQSSIARLSLGNLSPVTAIIRVAAWRQLREKNDEGYDEQVVRLGGGEDWLFWLELLALGYKGLTVPGLMWEYRVGQANSQREKRDKNTFLIRAYVAQKMKRYNVFIPMEYPSA